MNTFLFAGLGNKTTMFNMLRIYLFIGKTLNQKPNFLVYTTNLAEKKRRTVKL